MKPSSLFTSIVIVSVLFNVNIRASVLVSREKWTDLLKKIKSPQNHNTEIEKTDGEKSKTFSKILHDFLLPAAQKTKSALIKDSNSINEELSPSTNGLQRKSGQIQTPASDRIFYPPYKFPFWGLPYGLYSNGGFFNPGLFPFVPGGVAFPPYDGIFGGPFMDSTNNEILPDVPPPPTPSPPETPETPETPSNGNNSSNSYNGSTSANYPMPNYYSRVDRQTNFQIPPLPLPQASLPLPYNPSTYPVPVPAIQAPISPPVIPPMMPDYGFGYGYNNPFSMGYPNGMFSPYNSYNPSYNYNQNLNGEENIEEDKEASLRKMMRERLKKLRIKKIMKLKKLLKKQKEQEKAELPCCCDNGDGDEDEEEDNCNPDCECPSN